MPYVPTRDPDEVGKAVEAIDPSKPFGTVRHSESSTLAKYGEVLCVNPTSGALRITLPRATQGLAGRCIVVKNNSSSTNTITIEATGADRIDGAQTYASSIAWASIVLVVLMDATFGVLSAS